jgi:hypothetical protein
MINIKFAVTDIVGCRFSEVTGRNGEVEVNNRTKEYFYKLLPGMSKPTVGDFVVVSCQNGFQVCVVTSIDAITGFGDLAYVVGFVDVTPYKTELARQAEKKRLHTELMRKKKELEDTIALDVFAERSPEFKALLDAYKAL